MQRDITHINMSIDYETIYQDSDNESLDELIALLRELRDRATLEGAWQTRFMYRTFKAVRDNQKELHLCVGGDQKQDWADAAFIAFAANRAVPIVDSLLALMDRYTIFHNGSSWVTAKIGELPAFKSEDAAMDASDNIQPPLQALSSVEETDHALEESVKLQSHYAGLLNMYDGGKRLQFSSSREWMNRLAVIAKKDRDRIAQQETAK